MSVEKSERSAEHLAVECTSLSKNFGLTQAVKHVSLEVRQGSVHALVGENGAGKSTILGLLSGRVPLGSGTVRLAGVPFHGGDPRQARRLGLVVVQQELSMVPALSAEENVFLGSAIVHLGFQDRKRLRHRFLEMCADFDISISPTARARDLSIASQQMLEVMRAVAADAQILLLDEPSAALAEQEREVLHKTVRRLQEQGKTVLLVSHNLDEVLSISDTISVMRDGVLVETRPSAAWSKGSLIKAMVGREVLLGRQSSLQGALPVVEISDLRVRAGSEAVSFEVREGEILGLWGLVGAGRSSIMRAIAGQVRGATGMMRLDGRLTRLPRSPREAIRRGAALVPESRKTALALNLDVASNLWLGRSRVARRGGEASAQKVLEFFGFDPRRIGYRVGGLSGGNQQKVLLAKWAGRKPSLFLVDEPTRGIDIGAKEEVLKSLVSLAGSGTAIVVTSSELEEVLAIAHRLLVIAHGRVVGEIDASSPEFSAEAIVGLGFHGKE